MKKMILFLSATLFAASVFADSRCFLAKEHSQIIKQEGDCKTRYAPCSTFKIPISLMSYEERFLVDETHPNLGFKKGYTDWLDIWKQPHNPTSWIKNSCVWYSQVLTQKLGSKKFKDYVIRFNYGNQDISGDEGKNDGLTNSWLSSSLMISPEEQVTFLQNLVDNKLPVSLKSHEMTKNILFVEELQNGWKLYGKTGNGTQKKSGFQQGWFVGFIQKNDRTIVFANHIEDDKKQETYASLRAKAEAKEKLLLLISN